MREADLPDGSDALRRLRPLQLHALLQARQYVPRLRGEEAGGGVGAMEQSTPHSTYLLYICILRNRDSDIG